MFLDPRWEFIEKIAESQQQDVSELRRDLKTTLRICKSLADKLENEKPGGRLEIAISKEINQYSYHYLKNRITGKIEMLVGLYFAGRLGINCPLFTVESEEIQGWFKNHFEDVFRRSEKLLYYSHDQVEFNDSVHEKCLEHLE